MAYEYSDWTQIRVTVKVTMLDKVVAIMSMIDPNLMIEDMSDFQINNRYGELVDEALLNADKTVSSVSLFLPADENCDETLPHRGVGVPEFRLTLTDRLIYFNNASQGNMYIKIQTPNSPIQ